MQEPARLITDPGHRQEDRRAPAARAERQARRRARRRDHAGPAATAAATCCNALLALGYSEKEAMGAVKLVPEGLAVAEGIRHALKALSKGMR